MISILAIIITISIVVFVHELGHFLAALKMKVNVEVFSIGFGPEIIGITHKGIRYRISIIPLGGYVKMKGENPLDESVNEDDSFMGKNPVQRIFILLAGAFMNFVTGFVIFSIIIYFTGLPQFTDKPVIGGIGSDSPAMIAGFKEGDRILAINAIEIRTWQEMSQVISKSGETELNIKIERADTLREIIVTPQINKNINRALIGISPHYEIVKMGFIGSILEGIKHTIFLCVKLAEALWLIVTGQMAAAVVGPIGIARVVSRAAGEGAVQLFQLIAIISINLGFINLLPVPVLDGGHILFAIIEKIKGSPLDPKKVNIANTVGLALILMLFLWVFFNDIVNPIPM